MLYVVYVDGQQVAQGYIPKTVPFVAGDEGADVRLDAETPVWEYHKQEDNARQAG